MKCSSVPVTFRHNYIIKQMTNALSDARITVLFTCGQSTGMKKSEIVFLFHACSLTEGRRITNESRSIHWVLVCGNITRVHRCSLPVPRGFLRSVCYFIVTQQWWIPYLIYYLRYFVQGKYSYLWSRKKWNVWTFNLGITCFITTNCK